MTAREYLGGIQRLSRQIDANTEQLLRLRARAERITAVYGASPGGGSSSPDRRADLIVRIVDMERELIEKNARLIDRWQEASDRIDRLPREAHRTILKMRYLGNAPFSRIAEKTGYCERQIRRLHASALREFEKHVLECPHQTVV